MICKKCGAEITEEAKVCPLCGAELEETAVEPEVVEEEVIEEVEAVNEETFEVENFDEEPVEGEFHGEDEECGCGCCGDHGNCKTGSKIAITVIALIIVVGAAIACFMTGLFQSPALKAQNKYYNALISGDGKAMYELDIDAYELKGALEGFGVGEEEALIDMYVEGFKQYPAMFEENLGADIKTDIYVAEIHKFSKDELAKFSEHLVKYCGYSEGALQDMVIIDALVTLKGEEADQRQYLEEVIAKVDGKWYVGAVGNIYNVQVADQILKGEYQPQPQQLPQEEVEVEIPEE